MVLVLKQPPSHGDAPRASGRRETRSHPLLPSLLSLSSLLLLLAPAAVDAGCYHPVRMCCPGRNNTCRSVDDGLKHLPNSAGRRTTSTTTTTTQRPFDIRFNEEVGHLIQRANERMDDVYRSYVQAAAEHRRPGKSSYKEYIFGPAMRDPPQPEIVEQGPHPKKHLLIRYEIISEHLPVTVLTHNEVEYDNGYKLMYLEAPPADCYCDESCVQLGDCCSDYTYVCPRQDCEVSSWSAWGVCQPDGSRRCGTGQQQRRRTVMRPSEKGGKKCPALQEQRTCFKGCDRTGSSYEELTTVALLLDYRYNETRSRHSRRHRWMTSHSRANQTTYYCVEYRLGWVNHNCINPEIVARLYKGNTICVECQPEAQIHRQSLRCASDLEDGDFGFWKLIGPKSCNGIWTRITRTDQCKCNRDLPGLDPFLIV